MAVGYHKLNTSAARSRRPAVRAVDAPRPVVTRAGTKIYHSVYGHGVISEDFVSDCDKVRCAFGSGAEVVMPGGSARCCARDFDRKDP
jgi:hypothetical protein